MLEEDVNKEGNKDVSLVVPRPEWARRRRLLYVALTFIAVWLSYILWKGTDSVLYQQAAFALIGGAVMLIGQYIFGATWDDKNYMENVRQAGLNRNLDSSYAASVTRRRKGSRAAELDDLPPINGGR